MEEESKGPKPHFYLFHFIRIRVNIILCAAKRKGINRKKKRKNMGKLNNYYISRKGKEKFISGKNS